MKSTARITIIYLIALWAASFYGLYIAEASGPFGEWKSVAATSFARPGDTTAYASGDLVANSTTAGSVVPLSITFGSGTTENQIELSRVKLAKSTATSANTAFRIHLFSTLPTVSAGDNAAMVIATGAAGYLGFFDIASMQGFTDGATGFIITGSNRIVLIGTGTIYALIEARAAYAPGNAETFVLTLEGTVNR